jgi:hypothetical protein
VSALQQFFEVSLIGTADDVIEVIFSLYENFIDRTTQLCPQLSQFSIEDALKRDG